MYLFINDVDTDDSPLGTSRQPGGTVDTSVLFHQRGRWVSLRENVDVLEIGGQTSAEVLDVCPVYADISILLGVTSLTMPVEAVPDLRSYITKVKCLVHRSLR